MRGELVVQEYRIVRPDGTLCSIRETMFPIRDDIGQIKRIGGIGQDITIHDASQVYVLSEVTDPERVSQFLQRAGYSVKAFSSSAEFLNLVAVLAPGCVVFDTREASGGVIELLRRLMALRGDLPVVVLGMRTGDVAQAVQAMKAGAVDWLELPGEGDELLIAVASALTDVRRATEHHRDAEFARGRIAGMSERERQVLEHLLAGGTNKEIARELGISPRTVELHRAGVMERLGVKSLPEAVLLAAAAGVRPAMSWRRLRGPP
jgi:FixJ family two-component response regulator